MKGAQWRTTIGSDKIVETKDNDIQTDMIANTRI